MGCFIPSPFGQPVLHCLIRHWKNLLGRLMTGAKGARCRACVQMLPFQKQVPHDDLECVKNVVQLFALG